MIDTAIMTRRTGGGIHANHQDGPWYTSTSAIAGGNFEVCSRASEDRAGRIGAAADTLIVDVRGDLRVI